MSWLFRLLILALSLGAFCRSVHAEFQDCLFFDSFDPTGVSAQPNPNDPAYTSATALGILTAHNCARKTVEPVANPPIPSLTWSSSLAATAQSWANQCNYQHSQTPGLGENLAATGGFAYAPEALVKAWTSEIANYNYTNNSCPGVVCGHYTQVVWRNSTQVGCGYKACTTGSPFGGFPNWNYYVCNYNPPGNWIGQWPY